MTPFAFVVVGFLFLAMYVALRKAADFWKELADRWEEIATEMLATNKQLLGQVQDLSDENQLLHDRYVS